MSFADVTFVFVLTVNVHELLKGGLRENDLSLYHERQITPSDVSITISTENPKIVENPANF